MNIYEVTALENEIEQIAKENNGEIPEDLLKSLVEANTKSIDQVEKLCKFIRRLDTFADACDSEIKRISELKNGAKTRVLSIKKYMTPFVKEKGKIDVGTFKLSTRKSERLEIDNNFTFKEYEKEKITTSIDKAQMKKDIKSGKTIEGAQIKEYDNLQIK